MDIWDENEVRASVIAYVDMLNLWKSGVAFSKAKYNETLRAGVLANRSKGSINRRMANISAVLSDMGHELLPGYKPLRNVGPSVSKQIRKIIQEMTVENIASVAMMAEGNKANDALGKYRMDLRAGRQFIPPKGSQQAKKCSFTATAHVRDLCVREWILHNAKGVCEGCAWPAPFETDEGLPFLEVHHVKTLAEGGPDTTDNTVALCPNCHRFVHFARTRDAFRERLYVQTKRLTRY